MYSSTSTENLNDEFDNFQFEDKVIRQGSVYFYLSTREKRKTVFLHCVLYTGFIRKVYAILMAQLLVTLTIIAMFLYM